MNNACSTFKCSVRNCFEGETLRLLILHGRNILILSLQRKPELRGWTLISTPEGSGMQRVSTSLHVWCTQGWGSLLDLRWSQSCSWYFGWIWKPSLTSVADTGITQTARPKWFLPDVTSGEWMRPNTLEKGMLYVMWDIYTRCFTTSNFFSHFPHPPSPTQGVWDSKQCNPPSSSPEATTHLWQRPEVFSFLCPYGWGEAVGSELQSTDQLHLCVSGKRLLKRPRSSTNKCTAKIPPQTMPQSHKTRETGLWDTDFLNKILEWAVHGADISPAV